MKDVFKSPPKELSLFPFWAWNDTLDPGTIRSQIDEMVDKGVYGAFIHARSGIEDSSTPYFSDGWWEAIQAAIEYGSKKGFFTLLYDEDKWPSGAAGGRVVAANPEFAKVGLRIEKWEIYGPRDIELDFKGDILALMAAKKIVADIIDPESIMDISSQAGQTWKIPDGVWSIMAFIKIRDTGIQIDYLNREAVSKFIEMTHEAYYRRFGKYFGNTIPGIFFDEIYAGLKGTDFVWSRYFLNEFQRIKGYQLKPFLPHLIYDAGKLTPKIRCDYFDVFTTLYIEAWFKQIADWCEAHNIWLIGHTLETIRDFKDEGHYFRTWAPVQVPGTDNEDYRYTFPRRVRWFKPKQHSSLCHLYGKRRAAVEALGGGGWVITPEEYKIGLYMLGVYGLNLFIPHLFHYSTDNPKTLDDWPPSWFYRNPYWKYFKKLADLASRVSYMGSQGTHICDVCVLYPITHLWAEDMTKMIDVGTLGGGETGSLLEIQYNGIQETLLDNCFDYDIIDPDSIIKADCSKGKFEKGNEAYAVLILPPLVTIRRDVIAKIRTFFNNGGTVIALNTLPTASMEEGKDDGFILNQCKEIFGFDPRSIRIGYFEIDSTFEKEYIVNTNTNGGKAYYTKWTKHLPEILSQRIDKDVIVTKGDPTLLRVLHRRFGNQEIYFLVNEQRVKKTVVLSFRERGQPELWNPESGEISEISNHKIVDNRTEIPLVFQPWEGYYIVITPFKGLKSTGATRGHNQLCGNRHDTGVLKNEMHLAPIELKGPWKFIVVPDELDNQWRADITRSEIELPVFKFHPKRGNEDGELQGWHHPDFDDSKWKLVKIKDLLKEEKGCKRYLSSWDGFWINYYRYDRHWGTIGGEEVHFRREIMLENAVDLGWICITADASYQLFINEQHIGSGSNWKKSDVYEMTPHLREGKNCLLVTVKKCAGLLVQGKIQLCNGSTLEIVSNHEWEASVDKCVWQPAFDYIHPPLGPWGEIPMADKPIQFPLKLWYRQDLPTGAKKIKKPMISGEYALFVNGQKIAMPSDGKDKDISGLLRKGMNKLAIRVKASNTHDGILEPVSIGCQQGEISLGSWTQQGLHWYSGRAVYSRIFQLPGEYHLSNIKLTLDLGEVRYCAEIWINGKLVDDRPWPPYTADITSYVKTGENKISIVVANLLANRMMWQLYDESLTSLRSRFVHQGVVFRQMDRLESGLIGPVMIVPHQKEGSNG